MHQRQYRYGHILLPSTVLGLLLAVGMPAAQSGAIYQTEDEHGNPMFTDEPPSDDAEVYLLGDINIVQPQPIAERAEVREPEEPDDHDEPGYEGIDIVFPPADEATRRVTGEVDVEVELAPAGIELAEGHRVRIEVSGETAMDESAAATTVTVGTLNPGPHDLRASVIDDAGNELVASEPLRFYLLRHSVDN